MFPPPAPAKPPSPRRRGAPAPAHGRRAFRPAPPNYDAATSATRRRGASARAPGRRGYKRERPACRWPQPPRRPGCRQAAGLAETRRESAPRRRAIETDRPTRASRRLFHGPNAKITANDSGHAVVDCLSAVLNDRCAFHVFPAPSSISEARFFGRAGNSGPSSVYCSPWPAAAQAGAAHSTAPPAVPIGRSRLVAAGHRAGDGRHPLGSPERIALSHREGLVL